VNTRHFCTNHCDVCNLFRQIQVCFWLPERFQNVAQENFEKVKSLEANSMGIGWPLKAIFGFAMTVPYLIIVYLGKIIISKFNNYKNET
jgi:cyanate permease